MRIHVTAGAAALGPRFALRRYLTFVATALSNVCRTNGRIDGFSDFRIFGFSDFRIFRFPDFRTFTGPYWTLLDPTGPYWTLLDPIGPYWTLLDPTEPY